MLHPIDYRLSKNKFWLSTWNSYSLKNYRNLILNDKILNILGFVFKNCFKSSYSFASPWSNPRKNRKYFSNFVIGFDGRRAIRTGPNKVKKLPGFIIPEDYHIIRFSNFIVLKIYFLIDRNLETYWAKKQKNWRSPLKYLNMRYNKSKNKENALRFNKNLFISNVEKKNFKSSGFFLYLINLVNNNSIKKSIYLNFSDKNCYFKKDRRHAFFRFYNNNFKLLNKIRNSYFMFYLSNSTKVSHDLVGLNSASYGINPYLIKSNPINYTIKVKSEKPFSSKNKYNKCFNINYNQLNNVSLNYNLNNLNNFSLFYNNFNKIRENLKLDTSISLSNKSIINDRNLKAFTTFSFFLNKPSKAYDLSFSTQNKSYKSSLFNNLYKNSLYNFNLDYNKKSFNLYSGNSANLKFWFKNLSSVFKDLVKVNYSFESKLRCNNSFYENLSTKKLDNRFYIKSSRRRLPLLFFQGFYDNKKGLSSKTNKYKVLISSNTNKRSLLNIFKISNLSYENYKFSSFIKKDSVNAPLKSKNFLDFFILRNQYKNLAYNYKISSLGIYKDMLLINKNLNSCYTPNNIKSKDLYFHLFNKKLNKLEKSLSFLNHKNRHKLSYIQEQPKFLSLGLSRLFLTVSKNKWSNLYKIFDIKVKNTKKVSNLNVNSVYYNSKYKNLLNSLRNNKYLSNFNIDNNNVLKKKMLSFSFKSCLKVKTKSSKPVFASHFIKKNIKLNNVFWGKVFSNTTNYGHTSNNNFMFKEYVSNLPLKSKFLSDKNFFKNSINSSLLEYKPFLSIMQHKVSGYNLHNNNNTNFCNDLALITRIRNNKIFSIKKNELKDSSIISNSFINSSKLLSSYNWDYNKDFYLQNFFNTYFKKTFSRNFQRQDSHSFDDISQIELRLYSSKLKKVNKLLKFKPYSLKSVSKIQRFKSHKSVLTNYVKKLVKQNYLFSFYELMENKKHVFKKNLNKKSFKVWFDYMSKAKGGVILKNLNVTKLNYSKVISYSLSPFFEKLDWLKFFNKSIKLKETDPFKEFKKNKNKYLINNLSFSSYRYSYKGIIKKVQFRYFKRKRWSTYFDNGLYIKDTVIKPFKSLLLPKKNYKVFFHKDNYVSKFYYKFNSNYSLNFGFNSLTSKNSYKYKENRYFYFLNNKNLSLNKFFLEAKYKKVSSFISFSFKKNKTKQNLHFAKSNNLEFNKYIKSRLSNFFVSVRSLEKSNKNSKIKKEDLDLRIYGLGTKLSSPRIKFSEKKTKMDRLKPKTFLYWSHLKWFNIHIKSKFVTNSVKFDNPHISFRVYESFKKFNFNYYKNHKQTKRFLDKSYSSFSNSNFNKLKSLIFLTTFLKSKQSFLYTNNFDYLYKKKKLLSWGHSLYFLANQGKRLNYVPHIRYRAIRNSMYMWKINSRKLNLLTKYYRARSKFYKNKLNFTFNSSTKSSIISYLRLMESNFNRIRKSMQRDLPLISTRFYLKSQLRKLNSYMKILLKRKKKRFFLRSERRKKIKPNELFKLTAFYDNQFRNEKSSLPIKLFNFSKQRFNIEKKNLIEYVKKFIEHLFLIIFKSNNLRVFYIKKYQMNVMGTKAKLFKNLFNYRLATGFKIPFLVKVICKKLNFDKSLVGCKIGFFGRYSKKLRNRKIWRYVRHIKPSVISTPLDYYNILILQKWGITGIKLSMLRKKTFNFVFN